MRIIFLNPTAGKADCTVRCRSRSMLPPRVQGLAPEEYTIQVTNHAGHARELANAAAQQARAERGRTGSSLPAATAPFNEALTGIYGYANAAVGCLPFGSGNDFFLRTFGTKEEFLDLDAQLAGGPVSIDLMQIQPLAFSATICAAGLDAQVGLRHPAVPAHPAVRRRDGLSALHRGAALRTTSAAGVEYTIDGETLECGLPDVCHLQWPHLWRRFLCSAGGTARRWLAGCVYHPQGEPRVTIAKLLGMYKSGKHFQNGQLVRAAEPYFIYRRAKQVSLRAADGRGPIVATADGECAPKEQITVQVQPLAGRIPSAKACF